MDTFDQLIPRLTALKKSLAKAQKNSIKEMKKHIKKRVTSLKREKQRWSEFSQKCQQLADEHFAKNEAKNAQGASQTLQAQQKAKAWCQKMQRVANCSSPTCGDDFSIGSLADESLEVMNYINPAAIVAANQFAELEAQFNSEKESDPESEESSFISQKCEVTGSWDGVIMELEDNFLQNTTFDQEKVKQFLEKKENSLSSFFEDKDEMYTPEARNLERLYKLKHEKNGSDQGALKDLIAELSPTKDQKSDEKKDQTAEQKKALRSLHSRTSEAGSEPGEDADLCKVMEYEIRKKAILSCDEENFSSDCVEEKVTDLTSNPPGKWARLSQNIQRVQGVKKDPFLEAHSRIGAVFRSTSCEKQHGQQSRYQQMFSFPSRTEETSDALRYHDSLMR